MTKKTRRRMGAPGRSYARIARGVKRAVSDSSTTTDRPSTRQVSPAIGGSFPASGRSSGEGRAVSTARYQPVRPGGTGATVKTASSRSAFSIR